MKSRFSAHLPRFAFSILALFAAQAALACSIAFPSVENSIPFDSTTIPNATRVEIARAAITTRQILYPHNIHRFKVFVAGGAYIREKHPQALAEQRTRLLTDYLIALGIAQDDIMDGATIIERPHIIDGKPNYHQLSVSFGVECKGGCHLCEPPIEPPTHLIVD